MRQLAAALSVLSAPKATKWVLVAALVLSATSVGRERALDDWWLAQRAQTGLTPALFESFSFCDGDALRNHQLMDQGTMLPWWSDPRLHIAFFRPLAALSHYVDARAWPANGVLMHLHSSFWFALLLLAVALLYRRLAGSASLAGLSFALYAFDDAHGSTLGWLANRNALIAGTAGAVCLLLHDSWRKRQSSRKGALALGAFTLAWASGELAVGVLAYLISYALFLDGSSRSRRVASLLPYFAVAAAFRLFGTRYGYTVQGSGAYIDPLADPLRFLADAPAKWLGLLQGQFGVVPADLSFMGALAHRRYFQATAVLTVGAAALLVRRYLPDARTRFWLVGMALSLAPMAATFPSDRLLIFVGMGAMALLARVLAELASGLSWFAAGSSWRARLRWALVLSLAFAHLIVGPLLLPVRSMQMRELAATESASIDPALNAASANQPTFLILSAPSLLLANYAQLRRDVLGLAKPAHLYVLSAADSDVRVERTGPASFTLTPERGFLRTPLERHYRANTRSLPAGAQVELSTLGVEVLSVTNDGRPSSVGFSLSQPLASYRILCWSEPGFVPCELPDLGATKTLATVDFGELLFRRTFEPRPSASPH